MSDNTFTVDLHSQLQRGEEWTVFNTLDRETNQLLLVHVHNDAQSNVEIEGDEMHIQNKYARKIQKLNGAMADTLWIFPDNYVPKSKRND